MNSKKWAIIGFTGIAFSLMQNARGGSEVEALLARITKLHSLQVEYSRITKFDPDPNVSNPMQKDGLALSGPSGPYTDAFTELVKCRGEQLWYECHMAPQCAQDRLKKNYAFLETVIETFSPSRHETLLWHGGDPRPVGGISESGRIPDFLVIDVALGLRMQASPWTWITPDRIRSGKTDSGPDAVSLRLKTPEGDQHTLEFDPGNDYVLRRYHVDFADSTMSNEIVASDFRDVSGVRLPFEVHFANRYKDTSGNWRKPISSTLQVKKYVVYDKHAAESPADFLIVWPKGAEVIDTRTKETYKVEAENGLQLTDDAVFKILRTREETRQAALQAAEERINKARNSTTQP